MNPFRSFIKRPNKTRYDGEDDDENILYVLRASTLLLLPDLAFIILLCFAPLVLGPFLASFEIGGIRVFNPAIMFLVTVLFYLFVFGFALQAFLNWFFNTYVITDKKIVDLDFQGVLYKNISEATLDNIEDITSTVKGTFGVVFNVGSVFIQTAAEKNEFEFENVDHPAKIRDIIADLVAETKKNGTIRDND